MAGLSCQQVYDYHHDDNDYHEDWIQLHKLEKVLQKVRTANGPTDMGPGGKKRDLSRIEVLGLD